MIKTWLQKVSGWFCGPKRRHVRVVLTVSALAAVVILFWFLWASWGVHYFAKNYFGDASVKVVDRAAALGQAGDAFGGINALFAALAFLGVGVAGFFQYQSLEESRAYGRQQAFEQLFFHLLEQQRELSMTRNLKVFNRNMRKITDPEFVDSSVGEFAESFRIECIKSSKDIVMFLREGYERHYQLAEYALGPYFRSLYQLFKLIDASELSGERKIIYSNIARATLNSNEIFLLAMNCDSGRGRDFKILVERYGLLKHFRRTTEDTSGREALGSVSVEEIIRQRGRSNPDDIFIRERFSPTAWMSTEERAVFTRENGTSLS